MVVKVKVYFEKTRNVKNNEKSKKYIFYEDREMQEIMMEFYQIKRNLIISVLFLIQHNCILSRLPTSEASKWRSH